MSANEGKRMAGDYEIIHALHIGEREIVLGENPAGVGDERYMCAVCQKNELLASYTEVMVAVLMGVFVLGAGAFGVVYFRSRKKDDNAE